MMGRHADMNGQAGGRVSVVRHRSMNITQCGVHTVTSCWCVGSPQSIALYVSSPQLPHIWFSSRFAKLYPRSTRAWGVRRMAGTRTLSFLVPMPFAAPLASLYSMPCCRYRRSRTSGRRSRHVGPIDARVQVDPSTRCHWTMI